MFLIHPMAWFLNGQVLVGRQERVPTAPRVGFHSNVVRADSEFLGASGRAAFLLV